MKDSVTYQELERFKTIAKKELAIDVLTAYGGGLTESQKDIVRAFGGIRKDKLNPDVVEAHKDKMKALIRHIKKNKF